ncbi:VOC family protein [Hydrocarboniphaga sp.]|uniref:VOC family protein n=1 Tax=Hydrocarboniphaga sp. TaxID=2033016 RepID=UPI003D0C81A4
MIKVQDVAYVRFGAPDLDVMERFLTDFGLSTALRTADRLYMRGFGPQPFVHVTERIEEPKVLGFGLLAQSLSDLEQLATAHDTAVQDNVEPGGGYHVRLVDPQGLQVDVIWGHAPAPPPASSLRAPLQLNNSGELRRLGGTQRPGDGSSHVMRLGHVVLKVPSLEPSLQFYSENFGLRVADGYFAGTPENRIAAFLRCDLGSEYTDHHTVALIAGGTGFEHCAFEVLDWDDLMAGHHYLHARGHKHSWGIGRHIQGSQVFDYWRDPFGNKIEHWTDGDLINEQYAGGYAPIGPNALAQWAPEMGPDFML